MAKEQESLLQCFKQHPRAFGTPGNHAQPDQAIGVGQEEGMNQAWGTGQSQALPRGTHLVSVVAGAEVRWEPELQAPVSGTYFCRTCRRSPG